MPPKILALLGLSFLLVATATYQGVGRWVDSRIFTPLELQVALDDPHLKTPAFEINLKETYSVWLDVDYSENDYYEKQSCNKKAIQYSRWRVYRLGSAGTDSRVLVAGSEESPGPRYTLGNFFTATPGRYQLEWDIAAAAPCLNARHPRLSVWTLPYRHLENAELVQRFCVFLGGIGLALLFLAFSALPRFARIERPRIFPEMALRQVTPVARHAPFAFISQPPHWGLLWNSVLMILMVLYMNNDRLTSHGMTVSWRMPRSMVAVASPWPDTLEIFVRTPGRFIVNREEVRRDELRTKLMEQLGRRVEWTVYVEADPDVNFGDVAHAMDVIRSCGGKVSWITPKMRREWEAEAQSATK
jgi:biopolymer transport protein ExbD